VLRGIVTTIVLGWFVGAAPVAAQENAQISVRPVFVVPRGERDPNANQRSTLLRHLRIARDRYTIMLSGRDSFALEDSVQVVHLPQTLGALRRLPAGAAPEITEALLGAFHVTRATCPWVFVAIVMNDDDDFPTGAGQPINGGLNNGGGFVEMSSYALDHIPNVQSTFQHELGHAFGLPHVDVYGRSMDHDPSIMSYNLAHHTRGFAPSLTPGVLMREDLRALARNHRVFPSLTWDSSGAGPLPDLVLLGAMGYPAGAPSPIIVTTASGSLYGSRPENVVRGVIMASPGPEIVFDPARMWHSDSLNDGWVALDLTFPEAVELTRIEVHSGHSGSYHLALRARVSVFDGGTPRVLVDAPLAGMVDAITFPLARGQHWSIALEAGPRRLVVVRGLRFFDNGMETFPR
jgi:hypothetical protein